MRGLFFISALIAAILLTAAIRAVFGQVPDLSSYYQAQRNGAMDLVAQCSAANVELQKRVTELEKQLAEKK